MFIVTFRQPHRPTRSATRFPYTPLSRPPREARITGCSLHHLWREIRYSQFRLQPLRPDVACQQARTATNFQYAGNQWKPPLCSKFRQRLSGNALRSEENTSELKSLMRISYSVICLKKHNTKKQHIQ